MKDLNKVIQEMNDKWENEGGSTRSMKHSVVINGKTITADSVEELKEKIARSSNGKKVDSDSIN